jgi:hypothetical protein
MAFIFIIKGYFLLEYHLQSASANCVDQEVRRSDVGNEITVSWWRRKCGMLYGGPFTVIKIQTVRLPYCLFGVVEMIEIEDAAGNFFPQVFIDDEMIYVSDLPNYLKYIAKGKIFGRVVKVIEEPLHKSRTTGVAPVGVS